jgi:hypothetical protein
MAFEVKMIIKIESEIKHAVKNYLFHVSDNCFGDKEREGK